MSMKDNFRNPKGFMKADYKNWMPKGMIHAALAVTVTAVVLEDGDLRYQIIRKGDYEVDDYIGQLKLLGFAEGKSNASPVVKAVNGRNVAIIGMGAFKDNEDLTSITLPNSVAIIEKQAFMNCKNLATMTTTD